MKNSHGSILSIVKLDNNVNYVNQYIVNLNSINLILIF
jgi:hypothetical protein